ncbi:hypothetical protein TruAng_007798 [Truncatella angustata]|nr:hypothetical protein TruAng_007798 [Truncatella angustata]
MPAFFAKRGTTMPPNIRDDLSDFSHVSTLKMNMAGGGTSNQKRSQRPRASIMISILLLCVLAGMSIAAGICYVNHMQTLDDIKSWVNDGNISPVTTNMAQDALRKRQVYSYGYRPSVNVTTSVTATVGTIVVTTATETGISVGITMSTTESFSETAPGIPVTVSPMQPSVESTITKTITSESNHTITPTVQSSVSPSAVTVTVGVNNTITVNATALTLTPTANTATVTSTGAVIETETASSEKHSTITLSSLHPITVTVSGIVIPLPASTITTGTAAGITGAPPSWPSNSAGWNLTLSSDIGPTASAGTVGFTISTSATNSTSCTESSGSTATSNDGVSFTGSVVESTALSLFTTSPISTMVILTPVSGASTTLSTTCTESLNTISTTQTAESSVGVNATTIVATNWDATSTSTQTWTLSYFPTGDTQSAEPSSDVPFSTTVTETIGNSGPTKTLTLTKTSTASDLGGYSAQGATVILSDTIVSTHDVTETITVTLPCTSQVADTTISVPVVTETIILTLSIASHAADTCAPTPTVTVPATVVQTVMQTVMQTVTVVPNADQITIKNVPSSTIELTSTSTPSPWGRRVSDSNIPLISISPNTTVVISDDIFKTTKTITLDTGLTTYPTASASGSEARSYSSSSLLSHSISDLSTSTQLTVDIPAVTYYTVVGTGTTISTLGTGTPAGTTVVVQSTYTIHANHTSTGVPSVPVSAGSKRAKGPFDIGGPGGTQTTAAGSACVMMLVAILSLLLI